MSTQLRIIIGFGNAALPRGGSAEEVCARDCEVARILRKLADRIEYAPVSGRIKLFDLNGNNIGYATLE